MASNTLTYNQVSAVMNEVYKLATGQETTATLTGGDVVSVAQKALLTGTDRFIEAISQVIGRTIFSIRPYNRKFGGLQVDNMTYGAITRKITPINKLMVNDSGLPLNDGESVDPFRINKHKAIQLNFYGQNGYEYNDTRPDWQIDSAMRNAEELGSFMAMMVSDASNTIEKYHEETARFTIANLIVGTAVSRPTDVIHLLTEYNSDTGLSLTSESVMMPDNFPAFMKWVYSRVAQISDMMEEYSTNYHTNLNDGIVMRHTPKREQMVYLNSKFLHDATARVLADTYHDSFLKLAETESVNFWQNIDSPRTIELKPTYLQANGVLTTSTDVVTLNNVVGVIFDREAAGYTVFNNRIRSIYNPKGEYTNTFWKFTNRYWNDFTENSVVLLLD